MVSTYSMEIRILTTQLCQPPLTSGIILLRMLKRDKKVHGNNVVESRIIIPAYSKSTIQME